MHASACFSLSYGLMRGRHSLADFLPQNLLDLRINSIGLLEPRHEILVLERERNALLFLQLCAESFGLFLIGLLDASQVCIECPLLLHPLIELRLLAFEVLEAVLSPAAVVEV